MAEYDRSTGEGRGRSLASLTGIDLIRAGFGLPLTSTRRGNGRGTLMERVRALRPLLLTGTYSITVRRKDGAHVLNVYGTDAGGRRVKRTVTLGDEATADAAVEHVEWMISEGDE